MRGSTGFLKPFLIIMLIVTIFIAGLLVISAMMGGDKDLGAVPDFSATDVDGNEFTLSAAYKQGGLALVFLDRSNSDSTALMTNLTAAAKKTGVRIVVVAENESDTEAFMAYLNEKEILPDVVVPDTDGSIAQNFNVTACPITYFVNNEGSVRSVSLSTLTPTAAEKYCSFIQ